ncbi:MAG: tetratricopeptide repeat protein [Fimbriimonadaceae bacterium]|nr:tetratricopeptide repeat protein [Alphaproteobacteria bacterium]
MRIRFIKNAARYLGSTACIAALLVFTSPQFGTAIAAAEADRQTLFGSYLAARHAAQTRDTKAAAEYYRQALKQDPENTVILERAFLLELSSGNMDGATDLAERIVKIDEAHRLARYTLGVKALRARSYAAARRQFDQAESRGPIGDMTTALLTAWSYQGAGDTAAALKTIADLEGSEWFGIFKSYHSGLIAELNRQPDVARNHYVAAYQADSSLLRVAEAYIRFSARNNDVETARKILDAYNEIAPNHPIMNALSATLDAGQIPDPIIRSASDGAGEGLYGIGAALGRDSGEDLAIVFLELARYLNPTSDLILASLAGIHESNENYEQAIQDYEGIKPASPLWVNARIQMALNLNALERIDEAKSLLTGLIAENPENSSPIITLGNILRGHKDYQGAAELYSQAIDLIDEIQNDDWSLFYARGIAYERMGNWPKAEADLIQALELSPEHPQILNYLGYSWIDQGLNLDKAVDMIRRAVDQQPDDGFIVDSLGWAYFRLGDFEHAVEELEKAVELRPNDPIINDHLGDAYWRIGRTNEARFQWRQALDLKPEEKDRPKIEAKLRDGLTYNEPERRVEESNASNGG